MRFAESSSRSSVLFKHDLLRPAFARRSIRRKYKRLPSFAQAEIGSHPRIKSEGKLFGIMLFCLSVIFSENRFPLFGIILMPQASLDRPPSRAWRACG